MTTRITKTMLFADVISLLNGEAPVNGTSTDKAIDFIKREMELVAKKNAAKSTKPTATQTANEGFKTLIFDFLSEQTSGKTCTEIAKGIPELSDFNNQKISSLMRQMIEAGQVVKTTEKGKSLFSLA